MLKNINDLRRFDFTSECKTCPYSRELGVLEYCCSFVLELIQKQRFEKMKQEVYNYLNHDEDLSLIDPDNMFFENDTEFSVVLTFQTNLKHDNKTILRELRDAIMDNVYFNHVNFKKDSLVKMEYNQEPFIIQSTIDSYLQGVDAE